MFQFQTFNRPHHSTSITQTNNQGTDKRPPLRTTSIMYRTAFTVAALATAVRGHGYLSSPMSRTGLNAEVCLHKIQNWTS